MLQVGDRVTRNERREVTGATVIEIVDQDTVRIEYDEGGDGFWPIASLTKEG